MGYKKKAHDHLAYYFNNHICLDLMQLIVGKPLGSGAARSVFEFKDDDKYVIKFEREETWFQNVLEWHTWDAVCRAESKLRDWLAPCHHISPSGHWLVQDRTTPVQMSELPEKVPVCFTDLKVENWGRLPDGRIVCHDYGCHLMLEKGMVLRMKKADWYSHAVTVKEL